MASPLDLTSHLLPGKTRFKPGLLAHIHLHASAQQRFADESKADQRQAGYREHAEDHQDRPAWHFGRPARCDRRAGIHAAGDGLGRLLRQHELHRCRDESEARTRRRISRCDRPEADDGLGFGAQTTGRSAALPPSAASKRSPGTSTQPPSSRTGVRSRRAAKRGCCRSCRI